MGIKDIAIVIEDITNCFLGFDFIDPSPKEVTDNGILDITSNGLGAFFLEGIHPLVDFLRVMLGLFIKEPFQVT